MKAVRIYAVGVEDERLKMILISQMDKDGYLNKEVESFGFCTDYELESDQLTRSTFQLTFRNDEGVVFYGDYGYDPNSTNIYKKALKPGEVFSLFYSHEDTETNESILVIRTITDYVHD